MLFSRSLLTVVVLFLGIFMAQASRAVRGGGGGNKSSNSSSLSHSSKKNVSSSFSLEDYDDDDDGFLNPCAIYEGAKPVELYSLCVLYCEAKKCADDEDSSSSFDDDGNDNDEEATGAKKKKAAKKTKKKGKKKTNKTDRCMEIKDNFRNITGMDSFPCEGFLAPPN